jgi:hypothetical protein
MARPKTDDDATKSLKPEDETQEAKDGTRTWPPSEVKGHADFKRIVRGKKN